MNVWWSKTLVIPASGRTQSSAECLCHSISKAVCTKLSRCPRNLPSNLIINTMGWRSEALRGKIRLFRYHSYKQINAMIVGMGASFKSKTILHTFSYSTLWLSCACCVPSPLSCSDRVQMALPYRYWDLYIKDLWSYTSGL